MIIYIIYIMGVMILCATMQYGYLPANYPEIYFPVTLFPLALTILLLALRKKTRKGHFITSVAIVLLILGVFVCDSKRFDELNRSYYYCDSAFDDAAVEFLPALSEFEDAVQLQHYRGRDMFDEWIAIEVNLYENQYHEAVSNILQSYTFYSHGKVSDQAFVTTSNPFFYEGFEFQIVDLGENFLRYVAVIGMNSETYSLIYVFAEADSAGMMSLDHVVSFFMDESKMPTS